MGGGQFLESCVPLFNDRLKFADILLSTGRIIGDLVFGRFQTIRKSFGISCPCVLRLLVFHLLREIFGGGFEVLPVFFQTSNCCVSFGCGHLLTSLHGTSGLIEGSLGSQIILLGLLILFFFHLGFSGVPDFHSSIQIAGGVL